MGKRIVKNEDGEEIEIDLFKIDLKRCKQLPICGFEGGSVPVEETSKMPGGITGTDIVTQVIYDDGQEFRIIATFNQILEWMDEELR